jgi:4-amino-4-deoxy-L-arabinose transferase-like glycosyltransferase
MFLPLYYYLQLLAQLIFGNTFYAMSVLIMLLESTTPIMLFYLLTKVGLKRKISFLGALLYVFNPGAIMLAVSAWNPNLVPFFTIILLISGLWFLLENRIYGLLIAILAMVFLVNLHFQWFVYIAICSNYWC